MEVTVANKENNKTTYYAKDDSYSFQTLGQSTEVHNLRRANSYNKWQDTVQYEYTVLHTKLYMPISTIAHCHQHHHNYYSQCPNHHHHRAQLQNSTYYYHLL